MKLALAVLFPLLAGAATWPDTLGAYHRTAAAPAQLVDQALWDELGLKSSEAAVYENGKEKFTATLYQLVDTTASLAAFDWRRGKDAKPSNRANLAVETADGMVL